MNPNSDPSKIFSIEISDSQRVDIKIHVSRLRAQGLDLTPWPSTFILANLLHKMDIPRPPNSESHIPVLELGAGIGMVGIIASMIWKRWSVLTDLSPIVPGLEHNIKLNASLLIDSDRTPQAGSLDWAHPETLMISDGSMMNNDDHKAFVILAADTIYDENHPNILADCILKWLIRRPEARVVLTYPLRVAYLDQVREVWDLLERGGLIAIEEGKELAETSDHNWDDEILCEWSVWKWNES